MMRWTDCNSDLNKKTFQRVPRLILAAPVGGLIVPEKKIGFVRPIIMWCLAEKIRKYALQMWKIARMEVILIYSWFGKWVYWSGIWDACCVYLYWRPVSFTAIVLMWVRLLLCGPWFAAHTPTQVPWHLFFEFWRLYLASAKIENQIKNPGTLKFFLFWDFDGPTLLRLKW